MKLYGKIQFLLPVLYLFAKYASGLYTNVKEIKTVDSLSEFDELLNSQKKCLVQFYATWCRVSRGFSNDFINIAKTVKDDILVVAIKNEDIINKYKIQTYPNIQLFFTNDKNEKHIEQFDGNYKIKDVVSFIYDNIKNYRLKELNIDVGKKDNSNKKNKKSKNSGKVITLNDSNFDQNVLKDDDNVWFVFFYAPWCGHSKPIHPMFDELAKKTSHLKNARIAKIDATVEHRTAQTYEIKHYPSFRLFPSGNKKPHTAIDYNESRTVNDLYQFFLKYYKEKKEIIQLTSQSVFDEHCENDVCLLAILPSKEDLEPSSLKSYIQILSSVIKDVNHLPVTLMWTHAGDQLDIVQRLNLTFGFPTVIAISFSKNVYSILKGNYSEQSIKNFVIQMMTGKSSVDNLVPFKVNNVPKVDLNNMNEHNSEL
ncbi:protein disulfide-isomerase A6 [Plasmodium vinckei petteri]|uniref:protein disulfide-isomerase n=1 Tax=Plasmodium vinckei petteri TaxID=138298 RepID=W7ANR4_PLAVN|nr:protein disulfide-isomerase A6 [Plasmodium vinckei petteri]CAD2104682.1 protein disulfide isomerase related protein, putative [Plasmodium vinckei petteri]